MEVIDENYRKVAKRALKNVDRILAYYKYSNFYKEMAKINDLAVFKKIIDAKTDEEKKKIEEGIIYIYECNKEDLSNYEVYIEFLKKYDQYLISLLETDVREYYNNSYSLYLYTNSINSLGDVEQSKKIKFMNGKSLYEIEEILSQKANELYKKISNNIELDDLDKLFLEEDMLFLTYLNGYNIIKYVEDENGEKIEGVMYDIAKYFQKYPITNISTVRNKKLSILSILATKIIDFPKNYIICFSTKLPISKFSRNAILGTFSENKDNIGVIRIYGMDDYDLASEKDFLEKMFVIFHELGHLKQEFDEFNSEYNSIIKMELELIDKNQKFYSKYHNNFIIEIDADNYAITELIKEYGKYYPTEVYDIISGELNKKRIGREVFLPLQLAEYKKLK